MRSDEARYETSSVVVPLSLPARCSALLHVLTSEQAEAELLQPHPRQLAHGEAEALRGGVGETPGPGEDGEAPVVDDQLLARGPERHVPPDVLVAGVES